MKQQHHVYHGEALTHQGQQVTKEPCRDESQFSGIWIINVVNVWTVNSVLACFQHTGFEMTTKLVTKSCSCIHSPVLWLTNSISRARSEQVAGLGQSLDELGDALSTALLCPKRAHHGGQHSLHDPGEQFGTQWVSPRWACSLRWGRTGTLRGGRSTRATDGWLGWNKKRSISTNLQTCTH